MPVFLVAGLGYSGTLGRDVLKVVLDDKPKFKKLDDGKFVKTGEVETVVKMFKILEEV